MYSVWASSFDLPVAQHTHTVCHFVTYWAPWLQFTDRRMIVRVKVEVLSADHACQGRGYKHACSAGGTG